MDIEKDVALICEMNGIDINDAKALEEMDSLAYISIIVSLEESFSIQFPDEVLAKNMFDDLTGLYDMIKDLKADACATDLVDEGEKDNEEEIIESLKHLIRLMEPNIEIPLRNADQLNYEKMKLRLVGLFEHKESLNYEEGVFMLRDKIINLIRKSDEYSYGYFDDKATNTAVCMDVLQLYDSCAL